MAAHLQEHTDVILRDGSTLRLRPPVREDTDAVLAFFQGLTDESRYQRFHGFPALDERLATTIVDPDFAERGALIGCLEGRVVAVSNFVRLRERVPA